MTSLACGGAPCVHTDTRPWPGIHDPCSVNSQTALRSSPLRSAAPQSSNTNNETDSYIYNQLFITYINIWLIFSSIFLLTVSVSWRIGSGRMHRNINMNYVDISDTSRTKYSVLFSFYFYITTKTGRWTAAKRFCSMFWLRRAGL